MTIGNFAILLCTLKPVFVPSFKEFAMSQSESAFGPVISVYTWRQAVEDGVFVQLSGPGYQGDQWIPDMVAEAGVKFPLAMTAATFNDCVMPVVGDQELRECQDPKGRLWDVLMMLRCAIRWSSDTDLVEVEVMVVPNGNPGDLKWRKPQSKKLWASCEPICGPGSEPAITLMYPEER